MENKQTIICKIENFEPGKNKTGDLYYQIITSMGKFGSFEDEVSKQCINNLGKTCKLEIATRPNGYKNVVGFVGLASVAVECQAVNQQLPKETPQPSNAVVNEVRNIEVRETPNSWEFGKTGDRIKIYFADEKDLIAKAEAVLKARVNLNIFAKSLEQEEIVSMETPKAS